jgi:hypothetical protein
MEDTKEKLGMDEETCTMMTFATMGTVNALSWGNSWDKTFLHLVFIVSLQAHLHLDTVITILFSRKKTFLLKERNFCLIVKIPFGFFLIDYNK